MDDFTKSFPPWGNRKTRYIGNCSNYLEDENFSEMKSQLGLSKFETCIYLDKNGTLIGGNILNSDKESTIVIQHLFGICDILGFNPWWKIEKNQLMLYKMILFYMNSFMQKDLYKGHTHTKRIFGIKYWTGYFNHI